MTDTSKKRRRHGARTILLSVLALIAVLIVNYCISLLPTATTHIDLTESNLLEISEGTYTVLENLDEDITVYYVVQNGNEDTSTSEMLSRYEDINSHINVVQKDPILYPNFTSSYTDDSLEENSLIVTSEKRYTVVPYEEIYVSYYTYDTENATYYANTRFECEQALTSAIDFVTTDELPTVYMLTGHGEFSLSSSLKNEIERQNMVISELYLQTEGGVPEDAGCVFIYSPISDISVQEKEMLQRYFDNGGTIFLITSYTTNDMSNLAAMMADYEMALIDGVVLDSDADCYLAGYPYYLFPTLGDHVITEPLTDDGYRVLMPYAQGVEITDTSDKTLSVTPLLTTSDSAYSKIQGFQSVTQEKEEGDIEGPFYLGVAVEDEDNESKIVWYTSAMLFDDDANTRVSGGNTSLIINSLGWLCTHQNAITIHGKSVMSPYLSVPQGAARIWNLIFIGVIPLLCVVVGIVIFMRRKNA